MCCHAHPHYYYRLSEFILMPLLRYRDWSQKCDIPMHRDVVIRFIESLVVMLVPICPHWCDHIWTVLGQSGSVHEASWPMRTQYDKLVRKQYLFFREMVKNARQSALKAKAPTPRSASVYRASSFDEKKKVILNFLSSKCDPRGDFPSDLLKMMKEFVEADPELKKDTKTLMQFGAFMRDEAKERGPDALAVDQPFDQRAILEENKVYILKALDLVSAEFYYVENPETPKPPKKNFDSVIPGKPDYYWFSPV